MAEKYVSVLGGPSDPHDGSDETHAWTFSEMVVPGAVAAGDRVNIKSGNYTTSLETLPTGTVSLPIVLRGYYSIIGDQDVPIRDGSGNLEFINRAGVAGDTLPNIAITGLLTPGAYCYLQNLYLHGSLASALISSSSVDLFSLINCYILNEQNNVAAKCILGDDLITAICCDFYCSGTQHSYVFDSDGDAVLFGCRLRTTANTHLAYVNRGYFADCVFVGASNRFGTGIFFQTLSSASTFVNSCTFYNLETCISLPDNSALVVPVFINNHATDCTNWIVNLNATNQAVVEVYNRTRNNTLSSTRIISSVLAGAITSYTGDGTNPAQDYVNAAANNLHLISSAPGKGTGVNGADIGALQSTGSGSYATNSIVLAGE